MQLVVVSLLVAHMGERLREEWCRVRVRVWCGVVWMHHIKRHALYIDVSGARMQQQQDTYSG